ncbi:hypothetical protein JOD54_003810 [Actinokineospora baliensis]|uniref:hypothetical protein n=1 Tax=Actinokineospora baliensis TaxID=547056 RepID=UPI00195DBAD6|nr:hypothetical protein [Actinokineospora baliensis]MBM7773606.1 hypothetical protein [Actinokineospora baliensis]
MDDSTYVLFLVLGIALVLLDGQIIYRSGLRYLADSYGEAESARSMARLVSVLFHFAVLGVLLLISAVDIGGDTQLEAMVRRLGVVLLLLAVSHFLAIRMLTRMRDRLDAENLTKQRMDHMQQHGVPTPPQGLATGPAAGQIDSEDIARANGTAETRLSRAPGAEPGIGTVPARADGTVPEPRGQAVPGQEVPVRPNLGSEAVARRGGAVGPDGH